MDACPYVVLTSHRLKKKIEILHAHFSDIIPETVPQDLPAALARVSSPPIPPQDSSGDWKEHWGHWGQSRLVECPCFATASRVLLLAVFEFIASHTVCEYDKCVNSCVDFLHFLHTLQVFFSISVSNKKLIKWLSIKM
jgi:hypothetical protein